MDLKSLLESQLTDVVKSKIASQNGVEPATANSAVSNALDALLGGLQKNVQTGDGAAALDTALANKHDGSVISDVAGAVSSTDVQAEGAKILGHIFGQNTGAVAAHVGQASGVDSSTATNVLSTLAPIVLGQLGQAKKTKGLDATGIAGEILAQKLPQGGVAGTVLGMLDQNKDGNVVDDLLSLGQKFFKK